MYKKRWYDGLHDIYEDKNEFEIKFGCFGGDGGSKGGPKTDPKPTPEPTPDTGFRGEQTTAAKAATDAAKAAAQAEVTANLAGKSQVASDIQGKVADAVAASQQGPVSLDTSMQNMTMDQALGLNVPTVAEALGKKAGLPGTTMAPAVKGFQDYVNELTATSPQGIAATDYANTYGNTGMYSETLGYGQGNLSNLGKTYSDQPTQAGLGYDALGGTFSLGKTDNFSPQNLGATVTYSRPLAKGGVVQQGIGSIFPYPRRR